MQLLLQKAKDIERDDDGRPWSWKSGETIAEFRSAEEFMIYVDHHLRELRDAVAFTGSASLIVGANAWMAEQLKEAGLL